MSLLRTPEFVADVLRLHGEGLPITAIATALNTSRPTVHAAIKVGVGSEDRNRIPAETRAMVHQLAAEGVTQYKIGKRLGISRWSVRSILDEKPKPVKAAAIVTVALPDVMKVRISERVQRMRDSFKARGMSHEDATREAMRVGAGSAVEVRGDSNSRAAGCGVCVSFHETDHIGGSAT